MGYLYSESGLENVVLEGLAPRTDVEGEDGILIPRVGRLHRVIAGALVAKQGPLTGRELRFLRVELGSDVPSLANAGGVEARVLRDAEADIERLDASVDAAFRRIVREKFAFGGDDQPVSDHGSSEIIVIDASEPGNYRLLHGQPVS